jgi:hypothetical protein
VRRGVKELIDRCLRVLCVCVAWICDPCAVFTDRKRLFMIEMFTLLLPRLHFGLLV